MTEQTRIRRLWRWPDGKVSTILDEEMKLKSANRKLKRISNAVATKKNELLSP